MSVLQDSGSYWLGKIPENWQMLPAWALFSEGKEKCLSDDPHLVPSRVYGVVTRDMLTELSGNKPVDNEASAHHMKHVEPHDFVISMGSHESGIEHSRLVGKVSNDYRVLRPASGVNPEYYKWFFKSEPLIEGLRGLTTEIRVGQRIHYSRFSLLRLPLPSAEDQQRIADYLDRETAEIDAAVADLDRYVELLESRKIEKLKELIFADNEGEFPLIPVQLLFRKISSGSTPKGEHFYAESGNGVPWVTTSELREKIITETKKNVTPQAVEKVSGLVVFPRDTILIAMYGATIGRFGRLGVNAASNQACCALIDPNGIDPEFFYYSLYVHSGELVKQAFGGGQPNINQDTIRRFRAPVPSLAKQKKIAREMKIMVAETEDIIAESTKLRDLLLKRRSVLITEVVTGRKQV